jgi:hypothetical protein
MATGLLATCRQISQEATLIFWQDKTFLFPGDFDWLGLRRFLATIGPRAMSRMRTVEVFIPLNDMPAKHDSDVDKEYWRSCEAKYTPKLQMAKAYLKNRPWWVNMTEVCLLLAEAETSLDLRFIVPREFVLLQGNLHSDCWIFENLEDFQDRAPGTKVSVIIESGAILEGAETPEILVSSGLDVVCMPGRFWERNNIVSQNIELKSFTNEEFEYLSGVAILFREKEKIGVPALGGRTTTNPGYRLERVLKGFGGCRFTRGYGYVCEWCGKMNSEEKCNSSSPYCIFLDCSGCHTRREHTREEKILISERETEGVQDGNGSGTK